MAELVMGQQVSCLAKNVGIQWSRDKFSSAWKAARVEGTVRESKEIIRFYMMAIPS